MSAPQHIGKRIAQILSEIKPLAAEYYRLTGKPLGVTGEIAEYMAAEILDLKLAPPRTAGYDAIRDGQNGRERVQIKGRAFGRNANPGQRISRIKLDAECDVVMLVVMDVETLEAREIWEAPYASVCEALANPGSSARARGLLGVAKFRSIAQKVWSAPFETEHQENKALTGLHCPECGREFRGTWGGIDAHWKANHDHVMPYEEAWPLIRSGSYHNN